MPVCELPPHIGGTHCTHCSEIPLAAFDFPVRSMLADVVPTSEEDEWFTNILYSACFKRRI